MANPTNKEDSFDKMVRDFTSHGYMAKSEARQRFKDLIKTEKESGYEQGRLRCLQHHYPEELENARQAEREKIRKMIEKENEKVLNMKGKYKNLDKAIPVATVLYKILEKLKEK